MYETLKDNNKMTSKIDREIKIRDKISQQQKLMLEQ